MKRKEISFILILMILFFMTGCNSLNTTIYERMVKASPEIISCTNTTVDNVKLLSEYILVITEDNETYSATRGIASFEVNNNIYMFGHQVEQKEGSLIFKVSKSENKIETNNLIGEVISNQWNGTIGRQYKTVRQYSTIHIAKTIQLGEAFILLRDDDGNIVEYAIEIESFNEAQEAFFYSYDKQLVKGMSGAPIIQKNELIGIHFGSDTIEGKGAGRIIWNWEIVNNL